MPTIPTLKMFDPSGGIAALPPGKRITTAFDFWPQRVKRPDLPDVYEATARYNGEPRRVLLRRRQRQYRDPPIVLDLGVYRDSVPEQRKDLHDIHAVLVKIKDILASRADELRLRNRGVAEEPKCDTQVSHSRGEIPPASVDQRGGGPEIRRAGGAFVRTGPLTVRFRVEPSGWAST